MTERLSETADRAPLLGAEELIAECEALGPPKHFYVGPRPGYEGGYCQKPGRSPGGRPGPSRSIAGPRGLLMTAHAWIDPRNGHLSCPACDGYGYHDDGSDDGEQCSVCDGRGVATVEHTERWLAEVAGESLG